MSGNGEANMINLLDVEKGFLLPHVKKGGTAVDFTMGNGHDTLWLSQMLGETGKVFAFDIQEKALQNTRLLLQAEKAGQNCTLILDSHHKVKDYVKEKICVGIFNLGFLPGNLIEKELAAYDRREFCASKFQIINSPTSPYFFLVERK